MLKPAILLRRYKRFLADVQLRNGQILTIHCPNTGSMKNCAIPGSKVWYSTSDNKNRKYPHTWELVQTRQEHFIGVNTGKANSLVKDAMESELVTELKGYSHIQPEVKYGVNDKSRVDFVLMDPGSEVQNKTVHEKCFVEVKSVTLLDESQGAGVGLFPDSVSERATRHLNDLIDVVRNKGQRAVLFFCVQHTGINEVRPADGIDSVYGETLRKSLECGVEAIAYRASITEKEICLRDQIPVICS